MSAAPDSTPSIQPANPPAALLSADYLAAVARVCPTYRGPLPTKRTGVCKLTLYKARPGAAVEVWFRRITPSKFPELRVGVVFASDHAGINADAAATFEARFANELRELGCEPWPSDTNCDRRFTTRVPAPMPGGDLDTFARRTSELGTRYVKLLSLHESRGATSKTPS